MRNRVTDDERKHKENESILYYAAAKLYHTFKAIFKLSSISIWFILKSWKEFDHLKELWTSNSLYLLVRNLLKYLYLHVQLLLYASL